MHDEQKPDHGILNVAEVQPLDVDGVRAVEIGTALWAVAFVALLPFWSSLAESGRLWWLWTCTTGLALGLFGIEYCRRRRDRAPQESPSRPPARGGGGGRRRAR
ncbi:DUF2530 domain-containing protein [Nocardioides jishulii]|uniref:DUF2530 domain-containing protein n=1 Tax=Nocardioides jishulii TaxID=2575440 RepID=UPI001EF092BF|nr:DUF2530 domain-containing protein [Nocardioides jishulii]